MTEAALQTRERIITALSGHGWREAGWVAQGANVSQQGAESAMRAMHKRGSIRKSRCTKTGQPLWRIDATKPTISAQGNTSE